MAIMVLLREVLVAALVVRLRPAACLTVQRPLARGRNRLTQWGGG